MKQRKDGRWVKTITIKGQRKYFYSDAPTEKQAIKDFETQMISFANSDFEKKHKFINLSEDMLAERENSVSNSTYECYNHALKHLEKFNDMNIEDITPAMLQSLLNNMATQKYSQSAISKTKIVFGLVLDYAILNGVNVSNFMRSIKVPRVTKNKIISPDDDVIKAIRSSQNIEFGNFALTLLLTGMRRGELVAIQKKDIDFKKGIIKVWRSVEYHVNTPYLKDMPKTLNSVRDIPMLDELLPILKGICKNIKQDEFIFGKENPLTATMVNKRWNKYVKEIGYPKLNMHQLRHAYAKILYRAGVDVKTAQGLLGHADIKTTMNIYTDFSQDMVSASTNKINGFLQKAL